VILMFDGMLVPRIARPAGLSTAKAIETANSAKNTRVAFNFLISVLLFLNTTSSRATQKNFYGDGTTTGAGRGWRRGRGGFKTVRLPSFVTITRIPSDVVIICDPSGKVRIETPPGKTLTPGRRGRFGPSNSGGVGTSGVRSSCPSVSASGGEASGLGVDSFFASSLR
jgi:hypothetical protein